MEKAKRGKGRICMEMNWSFEWRGNFGRRFKNATVRIETSSASCDLTILQNTELRCDEMLLEYKRKNCINVIV
jgi:hypothetical protein